MNTYYDHVWKYISIILIVVFHQPALHGDIMREISIQEMSQKAEIIVMGQVKTVSSEFTSDSLQIYTSIVITPTTNYKGNIQNNEISIKFLGGRVGNIELSSSSMPVFQKDETVFVFLVPDTDLGALRVYGLAQGKFNVDFDGKSGRYKVSRSMDGILFSPLLNLPVPQFLDDLISEVLNSLP